MRWQIFISMVMLCGPLWSQSIFISRFTPGNYLSDDLHLVEIATTNRQPTSLAGYLIVTRNYAVRLPENSTLAEGSIFQVGKENNSTQTYDIQLSKTPDFLIRFNFAESQGNYVALFDPQGNLQDAFYHAPQPNVPFLPGKDTLITYSGQRIPYYLPPENRNEWSYLNLEDSPGLSFVQLGGKWQSATANSQELPMTSYRDFSVRYFDGIVSLKWATRFEEEGLEHTVQRSEDQKHFYPLGKVDSKGETKEYQYYSFYDKEVVSGKAYTYRIQASDGEEEVFSPIRSILPKEGIEEFEMEAILVPSTGGIELNLRFTSQYSQDIRIKLLDENLGEVAILFDGYVFARGPNLLKMAKRIPPGSYTVLATTETKRFGKEILVR